MRTRTPSIVFVVTPRVSMGPEKRTKHTRPCTRTGLRAFRSSVTHRSAGDCVPISWMRNAVEQAHDAMWHGGADKRDRLQLVQASGGHPVDSGGGVLDRALAHETLQVAEGDTQRGDACGFAASKRATAD